MRKNDEDFTNTRTRFQRLNDLKFFYGWVVQVDREKLTVRAFVDEEVKPGQIYVFELIGLKGSRTMAGKLDNSPALEGLPTESKDGASAVEMVLTFSPIRQIKASEEMKSCRKSAQLLVGSIRRSSGEMDVAIADVSPSGAGLILSKELKTSEKIELVVNVNERELTLAGEVRYCNKEKASPGMFRVGIQLKELSRVDSAIWTQFMEAA